MVDLCGKKSIDTANWQESSKSQGNPPLPPSKAAETQYCWVGERTCSSPTALNV